MGKTCLLCGGLAELRKKSGPEFYCEGCATLHFGDLKNFMPLEGKEKKREEEFSIALDDEDL